MGNDSKNQLYLALDLKEKSTHIHTPPNRTPCPALTFSQLQGQYPREAWTARREGSEAIDR